MSGPEQRKKSAWKKRNLRYLLLEPFKQVKLGIYVLACSVVFVAVAAYLIYDGLTANYQQVMEIFKVVDPSKQWEFTTNDVLMSNGLKIGIAFLVYLIGLIGIVLRFTHKIYGPLVSIERYIDRVTEGNYRERVKTRDGDDLQILVKKLNVLADRLEQKYGGNERRADNRSDNRSNSRTDDRSRNKRPYRGNSRNQKNPDKKHPKAS